MIKNVKELYCNYTIVWTMTLLLSFGSHFAGHSIEGLKSVIKEALNISNLQYSILQSSSSLINTVLPIIGGVSVDYFGTSFGCLFSTLTIAIGSFLISISAETASYKLMVFGNLVYGVGSGIIMIVQKSIISQKLNNEKTSINLGLSLAVGRLASFISLLSVNKIRETTGHYKNSLWTSFFTCFFSFLCGLVYVYFVKYLNKAEDTQNTNTRGFNFRYVCYYPTIFWSFVIMGYILGGGWTAFLHTSTELISKNYDLSTTNASYYSSLSQIGPLFLPPLAGIIIQKYDKKYLINFVASSLFMISILSLYLTKISPAYSLLLFSCSLGIGPVALISSISSLVSKDRIGLALGLYSSAVSVGSIIQDLFLGIIQDHSKYKNTITFFLFIGLFSKIVLIWTWILNKEQNNAKLRRTPTNERTPFLQKEDKKQISFPVKITGIILCICWILYILSSFKFIK